MQLFQQGNGSEAVQAAAVDQLHARCGKNGKDLDLRCIQLGQKRRKSCLLRGLIRQGRVDRLGRLIQLLCPVGGFSVIGKGTAITITFQADDTMLRDEHERKIGFGLAVRKLAGHDDVPVIFAHQLHQRGNELQNVLLGSVAGRGRHRCTSSFFRGQLPQNVASLTPQGQITAFLFSVQSRQGENIDFYLAMSLDGISVLNDLAGGVTVTLEDDFSAADPAMTKGTTLTLQGDQAEIFVRRRMDIGEGTNEARMVRQEEYLAQLSAQLESRVQQDQQFTAQVYDALQPYLVTDLAKGQLVNEVWAAKDDTVEPAIALEGEHKVAEDGFTEFYPTKASIQKAVLTLFWEPVEE